MHFSLNNGRALWAAALLAMPATALAQNNAVETSVVNSTDTLNVTDTAVANSTITTDTGLNGTTTDLPAGTDSTVVTTDDALANDMALANTVAPEREDDDDFPWGLLGLLGLAGLLGRKKNDEIHVDARDRRNV